MNYSNLSRIAINALKRNKFRAALTMLGIIIGVASVIAMLAIGQGSKKSIQDQIATMGANMVMIMPGSQMRGGVQFGSADQQSLTMEDMEAIKKGTPDITNISPEVRTSGQVVLGNKNWPTSIYGVYPEYLDIRKINVESGRNFTDREVKTMSKVCLIGKTVITNIFGENVNPVGQTIRFKNIPLKIIGVLEAKGQNTFGQDQDDLLIAPFTTVQRRMLAITWVQGIFMSAKNENSSEKVIDEVSSILRLRHKIKPEDPDDFQVRAQSELLTTFSSVSNVMTILLGAIAGISLLVGGIGIMNIMYVSVTERTREIGLRMSVGGRGKDILMQFLIESMMLSIFGGLVGIVLGILAASGVSSVMHWPVIVTSQSLAVSFIVCSAIGIFFGWYPAKKAAGLNPIDALRYE